MFMEQAMIDIIGQCGKPATIVAMVWVIITLAAAVLIGPLGHIYLSEPLAIQPKHS